MKNIGEVFVCDFLNGKSIGPFKTPLQAINYVDKNNLISVKIYQITRYGEMIINKKDWK